MRTNFYKNLHTTKVLEACGEKNCSLVTKSWLSAKHRFVVSLLCAILLFPLTAQTAGLGGVSVFSSLGQPLDAEVEVTATSEKELSKLSVHLAAPEAYQQAGLTYSPQFSYLHLAIVELAAGRRVIRVTSTRPITESFVTLLIELQWGTGKFLREYTFLLDPPGLNPIQKTPNSLIRKGSFLGVEKERQSVFDAGNTHAKKILNQKPGEKTVASQSPTDGKPPQVTVKPGDTLADIAGKIKPANVTSNQAIISIYDSNPDAFFGSIHQLRANTTLNIPSKEEMLSLGVQEAHKRVLEQTVNLQPYQDKVAHYPRPVNSVIAKPSAIGSISPDPALVSPQPQKTDRVELRSTPSQGSIASEKNVLTKKPLSSESEEKIARNAAIAEQKERINILEKNLSDIKRLLELKDAQMARLQAETDQLKAGQQISGKIDLPSSSLVENIHKDPEQSLKSTNNVNNPKQSARPDPGKGPSLVQPYNGEALPSSASPVVVGPAPQQVPPEVPKVAPNPSTSSIAPVIGTPQPINTITDTLQKPTDSLPKQNQQTIPPATSGDTEKKVPVIPSKIEDDVSETSIMTWLISGGILLFLSLAGWIFWKRYRQKKEAEETSHYFGPNDDIFSANSLFGTTGGQSVDTENSVFPPEERDQFFGPQSTEVDPIAEAEVYIAYGREGQAEEILREALKFQPERQAIRLKLVEIYAARMDADSLYETAQEMYEMTGGQIEEWSRVVALGLALDPKNPLYNGQSTSPRKKRNVEQSATPKDFSPPIASQKKILEPTSVVGTVQEPEEEIDTDQDLKDQVDPQESQEENSDQDSSEIQDESYGYDSYLDFSEEQSSPDQPPKETELSRAVNGQFDIPALDFDTENTNVPEETTSDFSLDEDDTESNNLEKDTLDFESYYQGEEEDEEDKPEVQYSSDPDTKAPDSDLIWQEMSTKLELAKAYQEIGDKEGTKDLLEEVMQLGDDNQREAALAILNQIREG